MVKLYVVPLIGPTNFVLRYTINLRGRIPHRTRNPLARNSGILGIAKRLRQTNSSWFRWRDLVASILVDG